MMNGLNDNNSYYSLLINIFIILFSLLGSIIYICFNKVIFNNSNNEQDLKKVTSNLLNFFLLILCFNLLLLLSEYPSYLPIITLGIFLLMFSVILSYLYLNNKKIIPELSIFNIYKVIYRNSILIFAILITIYLFFHFITDKKDYLIEIFLPFCIAYNLNIGFYSFLGQLATVLILMISFIMTKFEIYNNKDTKTIYIPIILIFGSLGGIILPLTRNFISLYLALELFTISAYILASSDKNSRYSVESAIKYFINGSMMSGVYLIGVSFIYLSTGSISFSTIEQINNYENDFFKYLNIIGNIFVIFFVCFKFGVAPFHFWLIDFYNATKPHLSLFIGHTIKISLYIVFVAIIQNIMVINNVELCSTLICISILSMVYSSFLNISQEKLRRVIAYSSVNHISFALLSIAFGHELNESYNTGLIYISFYVLFMSIPLFAMLILLNKFKNLSNSKEENTLLEDLILLKNNFPFLSFLMVVILFSMGGVPPFPGFLNKMYVLKNCIYAKAYTSAFFILFSSVVSIFYYLKIVKSIFYSDKNYKAKSLLETGQDKLVASYSILSSSSILIFVSIVHLLYTLFLSYN